MGARKPLTDEARLERDRQAREMETSIESMAANGLTPQEISLLTKIKPERLYRRYKDFLMRGGARRTHEVAQAAYLMSVGGPEKNWRQADPSMAKFWLERRGGAAWAMPRDEDDGPDLSRLTVAQLIDLQRALRPLSNNLVMIDAQAERDADDRGGDGGADASGAGAESAGGVGVDQHGSGEVPPIAG